MTLPIRDALRRCLPAAAGALALMAARPAAAHWDFAIWGMSLPQVIAASGGRVEALPPDRQREVTDIQMRYQAEGTLQDGDLILDAIFGFDMLTGGLLCVSYSPRNASDTFALQAWIERQFGPPAQMARDPASNETSTTWREPDNIDMLSSPGTRAAVLHCARGT